MWRKTSVAPLRSPSRWILLVPPGPLHRKPTGIIQAEENLSTETPVGRRDATRTRTRPKETRVGWDRDEKIRGWPLTKLAIDNHDHSASNYHECAWWNGRWSRCRWILLFLRQGPPPKRQIRIRTFILASCIIPFFLSLFSRSLFYLQTIVHRFGSFYPRSRSRWFFSSSPFVTSLSWKLLGAFDLSQSFL